jgi:hypothetical protein
MMDNTAAGGLPSHTSPLEGIIAEGNEEAGYDKTFVRANVKQVGSLSFFHQPQ